MRTRNDGLRTIRAVFGKLAEIVVFNVGASVRLGCSGDLRASEYEGNYRIELIADKVDFFGRGGNGKKESADDAKI